MFVYNLLLFRCSMLKKLPWRPKPAEPSPPAEVPLGRSTTEAVEAEKMHEQGDLGSVHLSVHDPVCRYGKGDPGGDAEPHLRQYGAPFAVQIEVRWFLPLLEKRGGGAGLVEAGANHFHIAPIQSSVFSVFLRFCRQRSTPTPPICGSARYCARFCHENTLSALSTRTHTKHKAHAH